MRSILKINVPFDDCQEDHQSSMVEVEGTISQYIVSVSIDPGSTLSYISPIVVEKCNLTKEKHKNAWLVQLATATKRKVIELIKNYVLDINGLMTKA